MRDLFPGFYYSYPQREELSKLWGEAIFVFDANMLLNVYRYSSKALDRYLDILNHLKHQIWIPYQVANEYQENREEVIKSSAKTITNALSVFDDSLRDFRKLLGTDYNKHSIDPKELTKTAVAEIEKARSNLKSHGAKNKKRISDLIKHDTLRENLENLFQGKVGKPYSWIELQSAYEKAKLRFELEIPPGLRDRETKKDFRMYGDAILWFQLIDHARSQKKPLIFVTDDGKDDWWKFEGEKPVGPRPELIQEIFIEAGTPFYMYIGYNFLETGAKVFNLEAEPEVIEEAKEVSQQNKNERVYLGGTRLRISAIEAEKAVHRWLEDNYTLPNFKIDKASGKDYGVDFIISEIDPFSGNKEQKVIEVIVKYREHIENFLIERGIVDRTLKICKGMDPSLTSVVLILLTKEKDTAQELSMRMERVLFGIPQNLSIITGFVENNYLSIVSVFPKQGD